MHVAVVVRTRETVATETPAAAATSLIVANKHSSFIYVTVYTKEYHESFRLATKRDRGLF